EGRDVRQRAARRGGACGLRQGRAAAAGRACGARLPHRLAHVLRRDLADRRRYAVRARARGTRARAGGAGGVVHGAPAREGPGRRAQEDRRGGDGGGAGRERGERRAPRRGVGRPPVPPARGAPPARPAARARDGRAAPAPGREPCAEEERRMKALSYDDYQRLSEGGLSVPVFRELPGDLRTPVSAFFSLGARSERAFLLESVLGAERLARYSFLGRDPIARLEVRGGKVVVQDDSGTHEATAGLMSALRERLG